MDPYLRNHFHPNIWLIHWHWTLRGSWNPLLLPVSWKFQQPIAIKTNHSSKLQPPPYHNPIVQPKSQTKNLLQIQKNLKVKSIDKVITTAAHNVNIYDIYHDDPDYGPMSTESQRKSVFILFILHDNKSAIGKKSSQLSTIGMIL